MNKTRLFVFIVTYVSIVVLIRFVIPDPARFIEWVKTIYAQYGYWIIFLGALLEGTFLVGMYVPGSVIVLLGAALAKEGVVSFPLVIVFGTVGLLIGYCVNYLLGRHGWYHILSFAGLEKQVNEAKKRLLANHTKTLFLGYFSPASASFFSTAAGIVGLSFYQFFLVSGLAQLFWALVWGGLAYLIGVSFVEFILKYLGIIMTIGIIVWYFKQKNKESDLTNIP